MENSIQGTNPSTKIGTVNGRVSEVASQAHGAVDKAAAAAGSAVQSVNSAIDHAAESGHQAVTKLEAKVKPAEQWLSEKTETALAAPKNAISDARQYVVTHPWQSLCVALFAGALLGRRTR